MSEMVNLIHNHDLNTGNESTNSNTIISKNRDYIGFTFGKFHSSDFGIVRTSNGSRFDESLLPIIQDKTVQVPGGDGTYLFGSYFTQKQFEVAFAFDNLDEQRFAELKTWLGDKKIHDLIFDETPYKAYRAKITGSATIKYIPFEEGNTDRIYKGEGSIQFTAYEPYARCVKKYADEYQVSNLNEWKKAAKLLNSKGNYDTLGAIIPNQIKLYNPGDRPCDFVMTFNFSNKGIIPATTIRLTDLEGNTYGLDLKQITRKGNDDCIKINSKINLIEGYYNGKKTGNVYNAAIIAGDFFKIPLCDSVEANMVMTVEGSSNLFESIEYNYLYI